MLLNSAALVSSLRAQVNEVSVLQLRHIRTTNARALIIDIREKSETTLGVIPEVNLIPRGILEMKIESAISKQNNVESIALQPIYLICRSGARSVLAAVSLQQMGFSAVYSVEGGMLAWQQADYELTLPS